MKHKVVTVLGVLALMSGLLVAALPVGAAPPGPDYRPVDAGPRLRDLGPADVALHLDGFEEEYAAASSSSGGPPEFYGVGDIITALWYDDVTGLYLKPYEVRAIGEHIEVWVMTDLDFPAGDVRNPVVVTQEQIDYLVEEFDTNIYPTSSSFFGVPDFHDGSGAALPFDYYDEEGRVIAMISNIGDENYYDQTYPLYIAGFYWGSVFEYYLDRNVISIDAYDWENRVGPDVSRPYLYEGVFAHEYQHLLHDDYDADEELFVNEGCSMFAEYLNGYASGEEQYGGFLTNPENSLVVWEDQGNLEVLSDYGQAYLFQFYLMEKFGKEFIQAEFQNPGNGISGINSTLGSFNIQTDFADIYHDFAVAVLTDSKQANYRYGFEGIDLQIDIGTADDPNPDAFDWPGAPPWGTDYIWVDRDPKELAKFTFNGVDYTIFPSAWSSDGDVLWSGTGDLLDNWAIFETPGGGTLSFDTLWDLEDYWDFGFVQVSTDGGYNWTSLVDNEGYSTYDYDASAHPKVVANVPGLTSYVEPWPTWVNLSYDLNAYAGQDILVAFRLVTDWNTHYGGWWIDNVYVNDTLISDGSDDTVFMDITELLPINNDFTVTFVGMKGKSNGTQYKVHTMKLDDVTEDGLLELNKVLNWSDEAVMLVTFDAPEGFTGYADYTYDFTFTNAGPKK
jgi:immune inhibitor A